MLLKFLSASKFLGNSGSIPGVLSTFRRPTGGDAHAVPVHLPRIQGLMSISLCCERIPFMLASFSTTVRKSVK